MKRQLMKRSAFVLAMLMLAVIPFAQAQVAVGDILCQSGQIYTPATYPSSGAPAIGVVFYVDGTGQHGWAVALQDAGDFAWGPNDNDTPLGNYTDKRQAVYDLNGYQNTQVVRQYGTNYPAFYAVNFDNGWYVPAIGQLNYLYGNLVEVNAGLTVVGGTPFEMDGAWRYWSSTETSAVHAWSLGDGGELDSSSAYYTKLGSWRVRGVINF